MKSPQEIHKISERLTGEIKKKFQTTKNIDFSQCPSWYNFYIQYHIKYPSISSRNREEKKEFLCNFLKNFTNENENDLQISLYNALLEGFQPVVFCASVSEEEQKLRQTQATKAHINFFTEIAEELQIKSEKIKLLDQENLSNDETWYSSFKCSIS